MEKSKKRFIRNWVYFGQFLIAFLAFWAGDWWSLKLIITIPIGIIAYFFIAIPVAGGVIGAVKSGEIDLK